MTPFMELHSDGTPVHLGWKRHDRLKSGWTDLSDDDQWSEASMLRALAEKLTAYLDDGEGDDVIVR